MFLAQALHSTEISTPSKVQVDPVQNTMVLSYVEDCPGERKQLDSGSLFD